MPFTLAHPAIVLPLAKNKKLPLQALIIGSMAPDFEFYLQLREVQNIGHSFFGFICIDIPIGIFALYVYNNYIRYFLRTITPNKILYKCNTLAYSYSTSRKNLFNLNNFIALVIGISSHLFLDLFTHHYSILIDVIPQLNYNYNLLNFDVKLYEINQILFSLIGLAIILFSIFKIKPTISSNSSIHKKNLFFFCLLGILIFLSRLYFFQEYNTFWSIVIAAIGSIMYSLTINAIITKLIHLNHK